MSEWRECRKTAVVEAKGPYTDPDVINTLEGQYEVDEAYIEEHGGFYLMRGADGEVYPCALDIFNETYEFVDE
jgi:hypothetical protein